VCEASAGMLIGVPRYLQSLCFSGLWGQVDCVWAPPQKEQVWRNRQLEALHPKSSKLLQTVFLPWKRIGLPLRSVSLGGGLV